METRQTQLRRDGRIESYEPIGGNWMIDKSRDDREFYPLLPPRDLGEESIAVVNSRSAWIAAQELYFRLYNAVRSVDGLDIIPMRNSIKILFSDVTWFDSGVLTEQEAMLLENLTLQVFSSDNWNSSDLWDALDAAQSVNQPPCFIYQALNTDSLITDASMKTLRQAFLDTFGNGFFSIGTLYAATFDLIGKNGLMNLCRLPGYRTTGGGYGFYNTIDFVGGDCT